MRVFAVYALTLLVFLLIDLVWLGVVARGFYARQLGTLVAPDVRWGAAFVFYGIYVAGVLVLAVWPALDAGSPMRAAALGATLGLVAYAAWDLTNLAVLRDFPASLAPIDMLWGTVLTAIVATSGYGFGRWLLPAG